jgi:hypothetical protein
MIVFLAGHGKHLISGFILSTKSRMIKEKLRGKEGFLRKKCPETKVCEHYVTAWVYALAKRRLRDNK